MASTDESFGESSILKEGNSKFIESLNQKGSSGVDDTDLIVEVSNNGNADDKFHFCFICKQMKKKIGRHLQTHKDSSAVQEFVNLPVGSCERKKIIDIIRIRGDYLHNHEPMYNTGTLIVSRRPNEARQKEADKFTACDYCGKYLSKRSAYIHIKSCKEENSSTTNSRQYQVMGRKVMGKIHSQASDVLRNVVFPVLREDNITKSIRYDKLVILYGNKLCTKYKPQYQHDMIRNRLRTLGRFLTEIRKINKTISDFTSLINPKYYDDCIKAIYAVAKYDDKRGDFSSAYTAFQ